MRERELRERHDRERERERVVPVFLLFTTIREERKEVRAT